MSRVDHLKSGGFALILLVSLFASPVSIWARHEHHHHRHRHHHDHSAREADRLYDGYEAEEVLNKDPVELIKLRGFEAEQHYPTTKDGYRISVVRIVNKAFGSGFKKLRPVVFNHGLFETATIWLINSRNFKARNFAASRCHLSQANSSSSDLEYDLAFDRYVNGPMMLANAGHDVWLMSMRGTEFSQNHTKLDTSDPSFWEFSLDDFALKDLPTVVHYVAQVTGSSKVGYVGHSQATFAVFALLSERPEYADRIEPVISVAPVAYFHHIRSALRILYVAKAIASIISAPFPHNATRIRETQGLACGLLLGSTACTFGYTLGIGFGSRWPRGYYTHLPFTASNRVLKHFGQLVLSHQFQMYDYGYRENQRLYNQPSPPAYKVENIKSKSMCMFAGTADPLSVAQDIDLFVARLSEPLMKSVVVKGFNHLDLITHPEAGKRVFLPILDIFNSFDGICDSNAG